MKTRCLNGNCEKFSKYGGKGISVCSRWLEFENFLADMGERPEGTTLNRLDNDLGYYKENCSWATPAEQRANQRIRCDNTTGHKGVAPYGKKFRAKYKGIHLGTFDTVAEAAAARKRRELLDV